MTSFFVRYANSEEDLQKDLLRGYSFEGYMSFKTYESALEEIECLGFTEGQIKQHENGDYGFACDGLCGFMSQSLDDARNFILDNDRSIYSFKGYPICAIFEGEYVGDDQDGDLFTPIKIVEFHKED